jgi:ParB-like chromosome segregation protein Spo0J
MKAHPVADLFPMLSDDELKDLAEDIKIRGLLHPIVVYDEQILDGRNRYAACELAGVTPTFTPYEDDDHVGFVVAENMARRHMTKGQRAMIIAQARLETKQTMREVAGQHGVSAALISQASLVIKHRADLIGPVVSGAVPLGDAYKYAQVGKAEAEEAERLMKELRDCAPDLADQVVDGELAVKEAHRKWRDRETLRKTQERTAAETATSKLCGHIPDIAYWRGDLAKRYASNYNPADAYRKRIDRKMLDDAHQALDDVALVLEERGLL